MFSIFEAGVWGEAYQFFGAILLNATLLILGLMYLFSKKEYEGNFIIRVFGSLSLILSLTGGYLLLADFLSLGFSIPWLGAGEPIRYVLILILLIYMLLRKKYHDYYGGVEQGRWA